MSFHRFDTKSTSSGQVKFEGVASRSEARFWKGFFGLNWNWPVEKENKILIWISLFVTYKFKTMQKRYWLRGGIFLTIIGIISIAVGLYNTSNNDFVPPWIIPAVPGLVVLHFFGGPILNINNGNYHILQSITIIISLCIYFFVGAVLGYLYGKIKNRNKIIQ